MEYPYQSYQPGYGNMGGGGGVGGQLIPNSGGGSNCTVPITVAKLSPQLSGLGSGGTSWWVMIVLLLLVIWVIIMSYDLYSVPSEDMGETRYLRRIKTRTI